MKLEVNIQGSAEGLMLMLSLVVDYLNNGLGLGMNLTLNNSMVVGRINITPSSSTPMNTESATKVVQYCRDTLHCTQPEVLRLCATALLQQQLGLDYVSAQAAIEEYLVDR